MDTKWDQSSADAIGLFYKISKEPDLFVHYCLAYFKDSFTMRGIDSEYSQHASEIRYDEIRPRCFFLATSGKTSKLKTSLFTRD